MFELLEIGGKIFTSRLMLGTGKYRNAEEMNAALDASGCEIVTVALRRIDLERAEAQRSSTRSTGSATTSCRTRPARVPPTRRSAPREWRARWGCLTGSSSK